MGYYILTEEQKVYLEEFFNNTHIIPINNIIAKKAVALRQQRKMSFGDAVVAATAIVYSYTLVTRNIDDFKWIPGLNLLNPFEDINQI